MHVSYARLLHLSVFINQSIKLTAETQKLVSPVKSQSDSENLSIPLHLIVHLFKTSKLTSIFVAFQQLFCH